jgi:hypothetical protein
MALGVLLAVLVIVFAVSARGAGDHDQPPTNTFGTIDHNTMGCGEQAGIEGWFAWGRSVNWDFKRISADELAAKLEEYDCTMLYRHYQTRRWRLLNIVEDKWCRAEPIYPANLHDDAENRWDDPLWFSCRAFLPLKVLLPEDHHKWRRERLHELYKPRPRRGFDFPAQRPPSTR